MPISAEEGKELTRQWLFEMRPENVVDVGAGDGGYARRMRSSTPPGCTWEAIEVWEPYIDKYNLTQLYDAVYIQDIREMREENYFPEDVVIFGDVIEHMPKSDALEVLDVAMTMVRAIVVSLPIIHAPQGTVDGNPFETHMHHWTFEDMHEVMEGCPAYRGDILGVFWWARDEEDNPYVGRVF